MMRPIALTREVDSARAALFGVHPMSWAIAMIFSRVGSATPGRPLSANDTAVLETPAVRAISAMVGRAMQSMIPFELKRFR